MKVFEYQLDYTTPEGKKDVVKSTIWAEDEKDARSKIEPMYTEILESQKDAKVTIGDVVHEPPTPEKEA